MKIGRSEGKTGLSTADADSVTIRGVDLATGLIGEVGFTEFFHLLLLGERPTDDQRAMLDAALIAIAEHGLTPSVQTARMTRAAAPEAFQGAVAAGLLGCGSTILGTTETAGALLSRGVAGMENGRLAEDVARDLVDEVRAAGGRLPGFGHPLHKTVDPRCERLLLLAEQRGCAGDHCRMARALQQAADAAYGRKMVMNVSCAIPAVMLDVDFPAAALAGIPILARTCGLTAHLAEERARPIGFHMSHAAADAVTFDGEPSHGPMT